MRIRHFCATIVAAALAAGLGLAADVTGKWKAQASGRGGQTREVTYNFKAEGAKLTGTYTGFQGEERPITDGKIEGDTISFTTKIEFNNNSFVMKYTGKVSGDEIKFTVQREGGGGQAREFTAKRAS